MTAKILPHSGLFLLWALLKVFFILGEVNVLCHVCSLHVELYTILGHIMYYQQLLPQNVGMYGSVSVCARCVCVFVLLLYLKKCFKCVGVHVDQRAAVCHILAGNQRPTLHLLNVWHITDTKIK